MKVVQINSACMSGSTGKIVVGISSVMRSIGIEDRIYYSGNKKCQYEDSFAINSKLDIRVHQLLSRVFGDQGWHSVLATRRLIREIDYFRPDIVHLHNLHGYYLNLPILFRFLGSLDIPVIWTLHDCWAFTGHCTHYSKQNCDYWMDHCRHCPQKSAYPYSWFLDRSRTLFRRKKDLYQIIGRLTITTVSQWLKEETEKSALLGDRRIVCIPNGIDVSKFKPGKTLTQIHGVNIRGKKVLLGVANYWGERKGYSDFCKLAEKLPEDWIIVMVGLSSKEIANLPENVIGMKRTDSVSELVDLYTTAMAHFTASTEETFGLTILESMACGTPAIVYNCTACPELIVERTGYVVAPHDLEAVIDKMAIIKRNGKAFYKESCIRFAQSFREEYVYNQYLALYRAEVNENVIKP